MKASKLNGLVTVRVTSGEILGEKGAKCDAYVIVLVGEHEIGRTKKASHTANPQWNYEMTCYLHGYLTADTTFSFHCYDKDRLKRDGYLGRVDVLVQDVLERSPIVNRFDVTKDNATTAVLDLDIVYQKDERDDRLGDCPKYNVTNVDCSSVSLDVSEAPKQQPLSPRDSCNPALLPTILSPRFARKKKETSLA
eukprot:CAMPEP_0198318250 /NCGR_PEP_ID=MMETSP1450-20131203/7607_1 /TAXON_ID=753684 ORGANISM="Madagascaria erythrocladiodes, Strain CCMP3234" /NCGR_SAMPLE_ID=MMETSP1450 /ASSEMBLY_ACC=CAM_ASM_001115 /LENGTH=193 /DNA_ID=CAMNT_0044021537 /DNA_START=224 /DNA_END=805 /DNA_ORIENTATION=-